MIVRYGIEVEKVSCNKPPFMKIRLVFLFFFFLSISVLAQSRLNNSRQIGFYTYIYKLTDQEMFSLAGEGKWVINDGFLHTLIDSFREYFKEKTAIFCTKLKQGKYTFNIDLMPRYSGSYVLNSAKAEMMYFPVFFGREGMKKVGIN